MTMNSQADADAPKTCLREAASARQADTPPKPLYELAYIIAMLERQAEAKQASHPQEEKRR